VGDNNEEFGRFGGETKGNEWGRKRGDGMEGRGKTTPTPPPPPHHHHPKYPPLRWCTLCIVEWVHNNNNNMWGEMGIEKRGQTDWGGNDDRPSSSFLNGIKCFCFFLEDGLALGQSQSYYIVKAVGRGEGKRRKNGPKNDFTLGNSSFPIPPFCRPIMFPSLKHPFLCNSGKSAF
jgi:hypothetical protein